LFHIQQIPNPQFAIPNPQFAIRNHDSTMAKRPPRNPPTPPRRRRPRGDGDPPAGNLSVARATSGQGWALVHPRCVRECAEDLDEVRAMIAAGEADVAIDELRWLLDVCRDMIEAHALLGRLAAERTRDFDLARAHFGYGYQLGVKALRRAGDPTPLLALHPANRPFYDAGRGLAWCFNELQKPELALEVVERLLACDPSDPLRLVAWIDDLKTGGKPIVQLGGFGAD
jgi:hypothetical protein